MKKTYLLALAALALAISCQKNSDINDTPEVTPEPVMRTVTCTIADPGSDSKVAINATTGKTEWEVDDEILFHGKYTGEHNDVNYSVVVKLTAENISEDKKSFTATIPAFENAANQAKWEDYGSKSNIIAAYPASAVAVHYGDNWYYQNKFNASNLPLMSGFNDDYDSDHFTFYNLTGILSFVVTGDIDSYTLAGNNSEAVAYTGYASRIYKKTDNSINEDWVYAGTPVATVSGTVTPGKETRICIPGGVTFSGGFTITFSNGGTPVKTLSTTKSVDIPRNSYRPMGNVTSYLKDYVAPTSHDSAIDKTGATDLSSPASANCYIVDGSDVDNKDKVFTFRAYKGKSTTNVGTIASVEVLWETYNNAESVTKNSVIAAVDYDKQAANDYYEIVFKMPSTLHAGNAVIAAKNAGGTILWSWHIWVPNGMFTTNTYGLGEKQMMSRNLGALVDAAGDTEANADILSYGLMYQWGRKDPFPGSGANGSTVVAKTYPESIISNTGGVAKDMEYAIQNPNVFISATSYKYDWNTTTDGTLWGDGGTKSVNDPCPVGYRVPKREWASIFTTSGSSITGWALDKSHFWLKVGDPVTVFPITGYREEGGSLDHVTDRFFLWNSHHDSGYVAPEGKGYMMYFNDTNSSASSTGKVRGGVIRCVVE